MESSDRMVTSIAGKCFFAAAVMLLAVDAASQTYAFIELHDEQSLLSVASRVNSTGQVLVHVTLPSGHTAFVWDETNGRQYLGTLPGGSFAVPQDMNEAGQVVGLADLPTAGHAFLWDVTNGMQDLGTLPGGLDSQAWDINELGQIVGSSQVAGLNTACLWNATNGIYNLGALPGYDQSGAGCINNVGKVAGSLVGHVGGTQDVFLWDAANGMQNLGALPGLPWANPAAINNAGQIVGMSRDMGSSSSRAFIWDAANGMQDLGTLGGSTAQVFCYVPTRVLNEAGQVVGVSQTSSGHDHAFVWDATNGMQDLGALTSMADSAAQAINGAGWIVGVGNKPVAKAAPSVTSEQYAILWKPASGNTYDMIDLSEHIELPPEWIRLQEACDINEHGDIVGYGLKTTATAGVPTGERAFLLKRARYTLTTSTTGQGTVVPVPGIHTYLEGTEVAVSASPGNSGWAFDHWEGDLTGSQAAATITMDIDKSVTAVFVPLLPLDIFVTLTISVEGSGTTNPPEGARLFASGTELDVHAYPAAGWTFSHWEGDVSSHENPLRVSLYSDMSLEAVFLRSGFPFECPGLPGGAAHPAASGDSTLLVMAAVILVGLAVRRRCVRGLRGSTKP